MKRTYEPAAARGLLLALLLSTLSIAGVDEPAPDPELEKALKAASAFEYGKDSGPLELVERRVMAASRDSARRADIEARLLGALRESATRDAKEFLCRQLRTVASARSVPPLEGMLADPELSPLARFVLERMEDGAAGAALVRSSSKAAGKTLAGILSSIGRRRDRGAVAQVAGHLASTDSLVARAAAAALGSIGTPEAAGALAKARPGADPALAIEIDDALLVAAERLLADRSADEAAGIYRTFLAPEKPRHQRIGALSGLAASGGADALERIEAALRDPDSEVRAGAYGALAQIGGPAIVERLLRAASSDAAQGERTAEAARSSLLRLKGEDADAVLTRLSASGDAPLRVEAARALAARKGPGAFGRIVALASDGDAAVRKEAIALLEPLAGTAEVPSLASAIQAAPADAKPALVRLLGRIGTPAALDAVRARLEDENRGTRDAAVRALADWPDASPAEDLFRLASTLTDASSREAALRGYVRLAGLSAETVEPYRRALKIASRPEDQAIVLQGLGSVPMPEALDIVEAALTHENAGVRAAAARAAVGIADRIRGFDSARARAAVEKASSSSEDAEVRRLGQTVIDQIEKFQGHVLAWAVSGPYREDGKDARALFDAVLPPEAPAGGAGDSASAVWKRLRRGVGAWGVDLAQALGPADNVAAYVRSTVHSSGDREARLELGSDDAVKAWLNGALVHTNFTSRGLEAAQDRVDVRLKQGANTILLKVVNMGGPWGFACRLRAADGSLLSDLKAEPALRSSGGDGPGGFTPLFDGKTLDGWEQKGGKALYRVEDGAIVGQTVPDTPNSFLCTKKVYGDFVLEYELRCDEALNSGVQIRSSAYDAVKVYETEGKKISVPAGRVHGYQVEIDPNAPERAWVGGVYDEGRRGWLYPGIRGGDAKQFTEQGKRLYRKGEWNKVRVEAIGPTIKTWLNGEARAELKDDLTLQGFIALQVHGVGGRKEPLEVRWRNLRIQEIAAPPARSAPR